MHSGVYIVEDMHTSYWPGYGGGLRHAGSFMETTRRMIDEVNAPHFTMSAKTSYPQTALQGIHVYDSMVVFEKQALQPAPVSYVSTRPEPRPVEAGPRSVFTITRPKGP